MTTPQVPRRRPLHEQLAELSTELEQGAEEMAEIPGGYGHLVDLLRDAASTVRIAGEAIVQLRKDHADEVRELQRDARDAAAEAAHEARQESREF